MLSLLLPLLLLSLVILTTGWIVRDKYRSREPAKPPGELPSLEIVIAGQTRSLTLTELGQLPAKDSTDPKGVRFSGPTLRIVLSAAGVSDFETLAVIAADGFTATLTGADVTYDVIIGINDREFVRIVGPNLDGEKSPKLPRKIIVQ